MQDPAAGDQQLREQAIERLTHETPEAMADWRTVVELAQTELLEVEESTWYRTPALKARGKGFARLKEDGDHVVVFVDFLEREALRQEDPETFVVTPHYENHPMMMVRLDRIDAEQLRELLIESWRARVPKRLLAEYDAGQAGGGEADG